MNRHSPSDDFIRRRRQSFERLDRVRAAMDTLLEDMTSKSPTMVQIAQLEALRAERLELLEQYQAFEDAFIDTLLQARRQPAGDGARADGV